MQSPVAKKNTFGIQGSKLNWFKNIYQCMPNFILSYVSSSVPLGSSQYGKRQNYT